MNEQNHAAILKLFVMLVNVVNGGATVVKSSTDSSSNDTVMKKMTWNDSFRVILSNAMKKVLHDTGVSFLNKFAKRGRNIK